MGRSSRLRRKQLAARYGLSEGVIAQYEELNLLKPATDLFGRFYTAQDEVDLQIVIKGLRLGFSIYEVGILLHAISEGPKFDGF